MTSCKIRAKHAIITQENCHQKPYVIGVKKISHAKVFQNVTSTWYNYGIVSYTHHKNAQNTTCTQWMGNVVDSKTKTKIVLVLCASSYRSSSLLNLQTCKRTSPRCVWDLPVHFRHSWTELKTESKDLCIILIKLFRMTNIQNFISDSKISSQSLPQHLWASCFNAAPWCLHTTRTNTR